VAYRELLPPPELAHVVRCVWVRSGTGEETIVLPDGCVDVIVRAGHAVVAGADAGPVPVRLEAGEIVTGVRELAAGRARRAAAAAPLRRGGRLWPEDVRARGPAAAAR
jgi:hypothetical protein